MLIYDFLCKNSHKHELLISFNERNDLFKCPTCGEDMKRQLNACRFKLDGCSGDFPTEYDLWEKRHNEALTKAKKRAKEDGTLVVE